MKDDSREITPAGFVPAIPRRDSACVSCARFQPIEQPRAASGMGEQ